jgi:predicted nucleotidyltransferase
MAEYDFDWTQYHGNLRWLPNRTIYITRHGSHAYGTALPSSDLDIRGVTVPPKSYYLGALDHFEQAEQGDPDLTIFELRKFISLATQANPNVIELLYTDTEDHLLVTGLGAELLCARCLFLSRRVQHTFSGYAASQLTRIRRHYHWLKEPPKRQPTRADFGLPERALIPKDQLAAAEAAIKKQVDQWSVDFLDDLGRDKRIAIVNKMAAHLAEIGIANQDDLWPRAARVIGLDDNLIEALGRERRYGAALKDWRHYQEWKQNRNQDRAELEARFGYDTKHAMHLVRLLRMAREILMDEKVIVRRPDAEELLDIRRGAWEYERLVEWAEQQDAELQNVSKRSNLPWAPDKKKIDALCVRLVEESLAEG